MQCNSANRSEIRIRKGAWLASKIPVHCDSENRSDITFEGGRGIQYKAHSNILNNSD